MLRFIDIFNIHEKIMEDYKHFVGSFINIKDKRIREVVESEIDAGKYWPEPLIQFNPSFEEGKSIEKLSKDGMIHPEVANTFKGYALFRHQSEALKKGVAGSDFVVTSGTGSGKSLIFLGTVFDYLFKNKAAKGIKAVIVYPMNALINSQCEEIDKYKANYKKTAGRDFPISYAKYTGQEDADERERIKAELQDIILTNYMMLELILTRSREAMFARTNVIDKQLGTKSVPSPSQVRLETFPFPQQLTSEIESGLAQFGQTYHEHRRQLMLKTQLGLTKTYNQFHNPKLPTAHELEGLSQNSSVPDGTSRHFFNSCEREPQLFPHPGGSPKIFPSLGGESSSNFPFPGGRGSRGGGNLPEKDIEKKYGKETLNLWNHLSK